MDEVGTARPAAEARGVQVRVEKGEAEQDYSEDQGAAGRAPCLRSRGVCGLDQVCAVPVLAFIILGQILLRPWARAARPPGRSALPLAQRPAEEAAQDVEQ